MTSNHTLCHEGNDGNASVGAYKSRTGLEIRPLSLPQLLLIIALLRIMHIIIITLHL
jgi:hypothetical protein